MPYRARHQASQGLSFMSLTMSPKTNGKVVKEEPVVEHQDDDDSDWVDDSPEKPVGRSLILRGEQGENQGADGARTLHSLNPYTRPLTISDLDSCIALENAAFENPDERCSAEKFKYRLTKCGELSLGVFCTVDADSKLPAETLSTARPVTTSRPNSRSVLLGHVVSTKTRDALATDAAMDYPRDWETSKNAETKIGHHEEGRTICIHSLAVLPAFQKSSIGRTLLLTYRQNMDGAGIADRLALIAHDHLVPYYEKFGFVNKGPSMAQFGGGGWVDMACDLKQIEARAMYG